MGEQLEKHLLRKLLRQKIIGSNHLRYDNILSGIPKHEIRNLKIAVKNLLKKEFLVWYNKSKKAIQLNKEKLKEIKEFIS